MTAARPLWLCAWLLALPATAQDHFLAGQENLFEELIGERDAAQVTQVRIAGMSTISESNALALIGDRLEHVRSQPPSASRASDAAFMAERLFRSHGFNEAIVTWTIAGPNTIQLVVKEGPRQQLGEVTIEGVDADTGRKLRKLFESPASKRRVAPGERPPFRESDITEGLEMIRADFQSRGYWAAEVKLKARWRNAQTGFHDIVIQTNPGPIHQMGQATFVGARAGGDGAAAAAAEYIGRTADTAAVNGMRAAVEEYYRMNGFVEAEIRMTNTLAGAKFLAHFEIIEGEQYTLGHVSIEGLQKTKPWRIRQRMDDLEGKILDSTMLEKRTRQLLSTGAFSNVQLEHVRRGPGVMDATLRFEEGEARGVSFSAGAGNYEGPIFGANYYDRNFSGMLWNLSSGFEVSARSFLGEVSLTDPWLWGTDASGLARLYMLSRVHEGYSTWKAGGELGVDYPVTDHYKLSLRAGLAYVNSNEEGVPNAAMGETVYGNPYLRFTQRLDYRDSAVLPTRGWNLEAPVEIGGVVGELSAAYMKTEVLASWHHRIGANGQFSLGGRAGMLFASGEHFDFPIDLRFFTGGPRSVRSYPERELGPHANGYPIGGEAYWVTNAEYVHPIYGALKGVAFVDAGGLSPNWGDFGFTSPDIAVGLGLRLNLPVGPIRLEYGHNMTQDPGEPSGTWQFAIGIAF